MPKLWRSTQVLWLALILLASLARPAIAQNTRDQVYSTGIATNNLYVVNANGSSTSVYTNYGATDSAAAAMRGS
ncbi:MAG TPA: hypothetical protein VGC88_04910, partial [Terriglobales bacterium]